MNDDDLSELILRASAYIDGELDADETADAEADSGVMAEVGRLRALQADVRFPTPPTGDARESALAAALAALDAIHTPASQPSSADPPARVVPFRPRPAYTRWLTAAAAVVAVGLLGVVVANGMGGSDDESGAAQLDASATTFAAGAERVSDVTAAAEFAEEATAEAGQSAPADSAAAADAGIAPQPAATVAPEDGDVLTAEESVPATSTSVRTFPPFDPDRAILDEFELGAVGIELSARRSAGELGPTPNTSCELAPYEELAIGTYQANDGELTVLIAVDPATGRTAAFDRDSCTLVAESPAP